MGEMNLKIIRPGVHQIGFRRAVHAPIDRRAAIGVEGHGGIRIAELLQPLLRLFALVHVVASPMMGTTCCCAIASSASCSSRQATHQVPQTLSTYTWPLNVALLTVRVGIQHVGERERRRRLADQRRGQGMDVAVRD